VAHGKDEGEHLHRLLFIFGSRRTENCLHRPTTRVE